MKDSITYQKEESTVIPSISEKVKKAIKIMQKFISAGGSRKAIEDYYNDCGTYNGVDVYLERMMIWLGMSDGEENNGE